MPPFFSVERLTKRFGGLVAVDAVGFELRRDQIVGLIGPNGAGKTTLLRLITKILKPDAGRIVFNGEEITGLRPGGPVEGRGGGRAARPGPRAPAARGAARGPHPRRVGAAGEIDPAAA